MSGVTVVSFHAMEKEIIPYEEIGNIQLWREELKLDNAESFRKKWISPEGNPLVSENRYGNGRVFYISCCMEAYDRMLQEICRETGTASVYGDIPECVECVEKSNCLILMNHSGEKQEILLKGYRDIRNEKSRIIIEEYGFAVAVSS